MKHIHPTPAALRAPRRRTSLCLTACLVLATLLAFTACQQDIPADNLTLPDGKYPVLISAAVTQTRVVDEGQTTTWEEGDRISVMLDGHPEEVGIYELNKDGTVKRIIDTLYYNPKETPATLCAWYPATETSEPFTVDYMEDNPVSPMYTWTTVQDYFQPVTLEFKHRDSKLRVQIEGDTEDAVTEVGVDAIYKATYNPIEGSVSTYSNNVSYIQFKEKGNNVWEGYVAPFSEISSVFVNGTAVPLDNPISTSRGKLYDVTINANIDKADEVVDLSKLTDTYRITKPGKYYFTGGINMINFTPIVVEAPATLVLDNVHLHTYTTFQLYITAPDTTTIKLKGNSTFADYNSNNGKAGITLDGADSHLLIEGPGTLSMYSHIHAAIGTPYKKGEEVACGDITIKNATLLLGNAGAGNQGSYIGTGARDARGRQKHGNITIVNSFISANPRNTTKSYGIGTVAAEGLRSPDNGEIHIYLRKGENEEDFLGRLNDKEYNVDPRAQFHPYEETPDWLK